MAKMRIGRTTPLTTDPTTGARIANPEKMGGRISGSGFDKEVSSWPVVREAYKSGKYGARKFTGTESKYDPRVENYLKGKTDILSEDIDEPMISRRTNPLTGENVVDLHERYKPGGPTYNKVISKISTDRRPKKGEITDFSTTQYESALSKSGSNQYNQQTAQGPSYVESFTPGAKKTQTIVKAKTPNTVAPKIIPTNIKKVAVTTPTTAPTTKSKSTVAATPKEDMTPPSRMAIKKPGLIKTGKQSLQGEYSPKEAPEYIQPGYRRENRKGGLSPTLAAKVVQKLTGYNKDYMEGKNGNFGEIDRSKGWDTSTSTKTGKPTETPRRTEFQGASSLKDIVAQKKYNKAYNAYASSIDNPANRNTVTSQLLKLGEFLKR